MHSECFNVDHFLDHEFYKNDLLPNHFQLIVHLLHLQDVDYRVFHLLHLRLAVVHLKLLTTCLLVLPLHHYLLLQAFHLYLVLWTFYQDMVYNPTEC